MANVALGAGIRVTKHDPSLLRRGISYGEGVNATNDDFPLNPTPGEQD